MNESDSALAVSSMIGMVDAFVDDEDLLLEALSESVRLNHPIYDMLYLVLARRNNATLFTLDKRLARKCADTGVNVIELIDF